MNVNTPVQAYQENIATLKSQLEAIVSKRRRAAWMRFLIVVAAILLVRFTWQFSTGIIIVSAVMGIAAFLFAVSFDTDLKNKLLNLERLLKINEDEVALLNGNYHSRFDGKNYEPEQHVYAHDLDIFGKASIYQYLNRATSEQGKQLLAERLLTYRSKDEILHTQQAVKEIARDNDWRQQFQSFGMAEPLSLHTEKRIEGWMQLPTLYNHKGWKLLAYAFPVMTITFTVLHLADVITSPLFYGLVFAFMIFAFSISKKLHETYTLLSKIVTEVNTLHKQLEHIENNNFSSTLIQSIKKSIQVKGSSKASSQILILKNILGRFDVRLNVFAFYILNTFLLWDLHQILALNKWKKSNQQIAFNWFNAIAQMEVISGLATLHFNQPAWSFPSISTAHFTLNGHNIGHPLIAEGKRVYNSFGLEGTGKVSIITGSNMGGKSTFLRSIGVNAVLALMGAPVCAESFSISPVKLMSSMRIADNLADNTSTFYAELKKLRIIIEAVNNKEQVFILLDEILRGTNSLDRHTGSKALIKQLIHQQAIAVIATHDVELAQLQNSFPEAIHNYHFDVQVAHDELFFDYKLKKGICQSLNASILMKKIGIEV